MGIIKKKAKKGILLAHSVTHKDLQFPETDLRKRAMLHFL